LGATFVHEEEREEYRREGQGRGIGEEDEGHSPRGGLTTEGDKGEARGRDERVHPSTRLGSMKKMSRPSTTAAIEPIAALATVFFFSCLVASSLADCRRVETMFKSAVERKGREEGGGVLR